MEDRTFELLEKIYSELLQFKQETNDRFDNNDKRFDSMDNRFDSIENRIIRIENEHGQKLNVLLDGYKQNAENINEINHKLDKLTDRVENQEIKL